MASNTWIRDEDEDLEDEMGVAGSNANAERISDYTHVLSELRENKDVMTSPHNDVLAAKLRSVNQLQLEFTEEHSKPTTTEIMYDAKAMKLMSSYAQQKAQALNEKATKFDDDEFANKCAFAIAGVAGGKIDADNLHEFGLRYDRLLSHPPTWVILYGALPKEEVKRKEKAARKTKDTDDCTGRKVQPEKLENFSAANDDEATIVEVGHVYSMLKGACKQKRVQEIPFWHFVIDPTSYSHTIDNLFHITFLIRDNRVSVMNNDDGEIVIRPLKPRDEDEDRSKEPKHQMYINISYDSWELLVKKHRITSPMITQRQTKPGKP